MKKSAEINIIPFLLLGLLAISVFAGVSYYNNRQTKLSNYWLVHTHKVLYKSEKVLSVVKDVETGARGFFITGDTAFLQPFYFSKDSIQSNIAVLKSLTQDNAAQQLRIDTLSALTAARIKTCSTLINLRRSNNYQNAPVISLLEKGKKIMDNIRTVISEIQQEENRLLAVREQVNEKNLKNSERALFIFLGSVLLLFVVSFLASRYFNKSGKTPGDSLARSDSKVTLFSLRMDDVVKSISDPFFSLDKNFSFLYYNDAVKNSIGLGKGNLTGKNIFEVFPQYRENEVEKNIREVMELNKPSTFEVYDEFLAQWQDITVYPTSEGIAVFVKDAGKRKAWEKELNATKQMMEETNQVAMVGGWEVDMLQGTVTWTSITCLIHETGPGHKPDLKTGIAFYKEGKSRDTIIQLVNEAIEEGKEWNEVLQIVTAKGNEKWIRTKGKAIFENAECIRLFGTFQDIDAQKKTADKLLQSEQELREEKKMLQDIIDNLPLNLYVKDTHSKKVLVNKSEMEYAGVKCAMEILGKTDFELYPQPTAAISAAEDKQVISTKKAILNKQTISVKSNGEHTSFLTSKIPLVNEEGEVTGLLGISYEMALMKKMKGDGE
jgi:PAS domain S-box-containing protein